METCASVRECPPTGKSGDSPDLELAHIPYRAVIADPAVAVWLIPLVVSAPQLQQCARLLSPAEKARIARLQTERDRHQHTVARSLLRLLLGEYLAVPPAAIEFNLGQYGRPALADPPVSTHFNLSHTTDLAICAISRTCVPGVDIEHLGRDVDHDGLARRFFSDGEYAEYQNIPAASRRRAFLTCWTRKEAIAKATGEGLHLPLREIEVTVAPDEPARLLRFAERPIIDWALYAVDAGNAYAATVAIHRGS